MAAQGYIGRAPGDSSVIVARQTFTPTGITTNFTFASGYTVGYVDAYLNGARLIEGSDYTATDGSVVGLTTHAQNGDVLELVVYKAFNVGDVTGAKNDFSVGGDLSVTGVSTFTGAITATGGITGAVTGDATGLTGTPDITIRNLTGVAATFTGVLSYDDVTNVDSVGFATFRSGINVQGAGSTTTTLNVSGVTTMTGDVNLGADFNIPDAITHVGDSNTKIRFPANDTFTVETAGSERFRIDSTGNTLIYGVLRKDNVNSSLSISGGNGADSSANIVLHGSGGSPANVTQFRTGSTERLRITSGGDVGIGSDIPAAKLDVAGNTKFANNSSNFQADFIANNSAILNFTTGTSEGVIIRSDKYLRLDTGGATERARIDSSGRVLVGATDTRTNIAGQTLDHVFEEVDGTLRFGLVSGTTNTSSPILALCKHRGTTAGSLTAVNSGDNTGVVMFTGSDGTNFLRSAQITSVVDNTPGTNDMPGRLEFATTSDGASNPTERMRITSSGQVLINSTDTSANQNGKLKVRNDVDYSSTEFEDNATLCLQNETNENPATILFHSNSTGGSSQRSVIAGGSPGNSSGEIHFWADASNDTSSASRDVRISSSTLWVYGAEGVSAGLYLIADEGDDNGDGWRINSNQDVNDMTIANNTSGSYVDKLTLTTGGNLTATGTVSDSIGDLRSIPMNTQSSSASYTLQASDAGKTVHVHSTTTTVVVPNSVFSAGDAVSIVNGDGSNTPTISQGSGFSLRNTGDGTSGNRTLGVFGMATIYFTGAGVGYISGSGMT